MRICTVVALALALTWLGCAKPEAEAPKEAAPQAPAATRASATAAAPTASPPRPAVTLPPLEVQPPADIPPDPRRAETPCDRQEAGWKWAGTLVEEGRCVVRPCACLKE